MNLIKSIFLFSFFSVLLISCASEEDKRKAAIEEQQEAVKDNVNDLTESISDLGKSIGENAEGDVKEALNQLGESLKGMSAKDEDGKAIEPVSHRELKAVMPDDFAGIPRTNYEGSTNGAFGMKVSVADAEFSEEGKRVNMQICDTGGMGMAMMGMAAWSSIEVDKETNNGYERTTEFDGYKAYEKYNSKSKSGQLSIMVDKRFVINCEFRGMEMDDVKDELEDMDLSDLKSL